VRLSLLAGAEGGVKYLNNVIEQDHRSVKKKVRAAQCFKRFHTASSSMSLKS
jgi:transposase-like protein